MIRFIITLVLLIALFCAGEAKEIYPDSLDDLLGAEKTDSALSIRAELAYARGLYQAANDLASRIDKPSQKDLFILGQTCYVLAESHAARGYFARIDDPEYLPLALLGLAELYCGDIADEDSCIRYKAIIKNMDYLSRYVRLEIPGEGNKEIEESESMIEGQWTLQFGAFKMKSLAEQMAVKVKKEGIFTWIIPRDLDGEILYFVYGGNFDNKEDAQARADALAKEFACDAVMMPSQ